MPVKMISDMPLPMPRSVICSPSHMMKAVPVVSDSIVIRTKPKPGLRTKLPSDACSIVRDAERLHHRQDDRQIAGPLRDLAPAEFAFLLQFLERRNHHGQQLQDDRRRDVRHDAQREDRQAPECAAGEQIEEAEEASRRCCLKNSSNRSSVDSRASGCGRPGGRPPAGQREQDAACGGPERETCSRTLRRTCSWIALCVSRAMRSAAGLADHLRLAAGRLDLLLAPISRKLCACTVIARVNSPVPRTFRPSFNFLITPSCDQRVGVERIAFELVQAVRG